MITTGVTRTILDLVRNYVGPSDCKSHGKTLLTSLQAGATGTRRINKHLTKMDGKVRIIPTSKFSINHDV